MFAYCANNPVRYSDPSGNFLIEALIVEVGTGWALTIIIGGITIFSGIVYASVEAIVNWVSELYYRPFIEVIPAEQELEQASISEYKPHTKNQTESNRNKHENADARRQRDQGGEKKKQKVGWKPNPNKRGANKFEPVCYVPD